MIHCWYKFQFDLNAKQNISFKMLIMHQLNPCSNIPPPPWAFELVKVGLFKFPPCEAKIVFKCTSQFLVKGKISGHYFRQWPSFKTETLFSEAVWIKNKIFTLKHLYIKRSSNCITLNVLDISGSNSPLQPDKVKIPHPPNLDKGQMPMGCPGGNEETSNCSAHTTIYYRHFRGQSILTPRLCENPTTPNFVAQYTAMDCPTGKMPVKWKGFLCIWTIEKMCCLQLTYKKFVPEITAAWSSWGKKFQHIQQGRAFNLANVTALNSCWYSR